MSPGTIPEADCSLDLPRLAGVIKAEGPDIVALQEVDRFWARSGGVDQPEELGRLLGMDYRYGPNLIHEADSHAEVEHEYGVATLSRYPIIGSQHHLLPTAEGWEQRGMLDTRIDVPGIGEVCVINTHLQVDDGEHRTEAARQRNEQSRAIADYVENLSIPVIVMGDFNTKPETGDIDSLIGAGSNLTDTWALKGEGSGETIFAGAGGEPSARIDYILVSSHFGVIRSEVIDNPHSRMASDHFPIVAELVLR